jgi:hypothetical protein
MDLDTLPAPDEEPPLPVWRTLGLDVVVALLPRLNGTLRDVFVLHVGGSSVPAIAARLGISVTQVSARLFRARRRLRAMLLAGERQDRGGTRDPGRAAPAPRSRPRLEYSSPRPAVAVPRPAAADFRQRRARGETANAAPSIGAREGRRGARHGRGTRDRREAAAD